MDIKDLNDLRSDFEQMQKQLNEDSCVEGTCVTDENREDYPDYLVAMYKEIMPPVKSGIYFSRWDLKGMAEEVGDSIAIDVRERMFQKFMQWIATPNDMQAVMDQFKNNIDMKCEQYKIYAEKYPATKAIFDEKIAKAESSKRYLDKIYDEFFT